MDRLGLVTLKLNSMGLVAFYIPEHQLTHLFGEDHKGIINNSKNILMVFGNYTLKEEIFLHLPCKEQPIN